MPKDAKRRRIALPERGVELAVLDWGGDGPLALLHHANGFCAALWEPLALALRARYRVVALDARGHGDSSKPDPELADAYAWGAFGEDALALARRLVAELGDGRAGLALGHSFGGTSLMVAASLAPKLFDALVMLDPVMHPPAGYAQADPRREGGAELADRARRRRQVFESREAARTSWSEKELFADWQPRAFELYLEEGLADRPDGQVELKCRSEVEAAIFQAGRGFDPWPYLDRVLTPALWMRAERGNFPRFVYDQAAQRMADARVIDLPLGHLMLMEDPEGVLRELTAFVDAGAAQRSTG